jgi:hypothetical protein
MGAPRGWTWTHSYFISTCERPGSDPTLSYFQPAPSYSSSLAVSSARHVNTCDSLAIRHALSCGKRTPTRRIIPNSGASNGRPASPTSFARTRGSRNDELAVNSLGLTPRSDMVRFRADQGHSAKDQHRRHTLSSSWICRLVRSSCTLSCLCGLHLSEQRVKLFRCTRSPRSIGPVTCHQEQLNADELGEETKTRCSCAGSGIHSAWCRREFILWPSRGFTTTAARSFWTIGRGETMFSAVQALRYLSGWRFQRHA